MLRWLPRETTSNHSKAMRPGPQSFCVFVCLAEQLAPNHALWVVVVAHHEAIHHSVRTNRNALRDHHLFWLKKCRGKSGEKVVQRSPQLSIVHTSVFRRKLDTLNRWILVGDQRTQKFRGISRRKFFKLKKKKKSQDVASVRWHHVASQYQQICQHNLWQATAWRSCTEDRECFEWKTKGTAVPRYKYTK